MSQRLSLTKVVGESMIHIIEPVADQAVRFIINKLGYTKLFGENIHIVSDFRETATTQDVNGNAQLIDYRVVARLTPSVNPTNNKWEGMKTAIDLGNGNTLIRQADVHKIKRPWSGHDITSRDFSIFHDDSTFVDLTEWNVGSTLSLEVKMDFKNLSPAQEAISRIFAVFNNGDKIGYMPLQYDYPIPKDQQNVLSKIYQMSGLESTPSVAGFSNWLVDHSNQCLAFNVNRDNVDISELVGLKNNQEAIFLLECSQDAPEVGDSRYTVNFTLAVQYSRVNRLILDYPIVINNQLLDFDFVPVNSDVRLANKGPYQWQNSAVDAFFKSQYKPNNPTVIKVPWWDPWYVPSSSIVAKSGYRPIFEAALTLDNLTSETDFTTLDLKEGLPGYKLSDEIIEIMAKDKRKCLGHYASQVSIAVYAHDYQIEPNDIYHLTADKKYKSGKDYYTYNSTTEKYTKVDTTSLIDTYIPPATNTHEYSPLIEFDGRYLTLKSRRTEPIYRLVISLRPPRTTTHEINWVWITTIVPVREGN